MDDFNSFRTLLPSFLFHRAILEKAIKIKNALLSLRKCLCVTCSKKHMLCAIHKVGSVSLSRVIKGTIAKWGEAYTTQLSQGTSFSEPSLWWSLTISSVKRISKVSRISKKNTRNWNVTGSHRDPCNLCASLILHNMKPAARDGVERRGRRERRRDEERREERPHGVIQRQDWNSLSSCLWHICWRCAC